MDTKPKKRSSRTKRPEQEQLLTRQQAIDLTKQPPLDYPLPELGSVEEMNHRAGQELHERARRLYKEAQELEQARFTKPANIILAALAGSAILIGLYFMVKPAASQDSLPTEKFLHTCSIRLGTQFSIDNLEDEEGPLTADQTQMLQAESLKPTKDGLDFTPWEKSESVRTTCHILWTDVLMQMTATPKTMDPTYRRRMPTTLLPMKKAEISSSTNPFSVLLGDSH